MKLNQLFFMNCCRNCSFFFMSNFWYILTQSKVPRVFFLHSFIVIYCIRLRNRLYFYREGTWWNLKIVEQTIYSEKIPSLIYISLSTYFQNLLFHDFPPQSWQRPAQAALRENSWKETHIIYCNVFLHILARCAEETPWAKKCHQKWLNGVIITILYDI